jgi:hypothetical protein
MGLASLANIFELYRYDLLSLRVSRALVLDPDRTRIRDQVSGEVWLAEESWLECKRVFCHLFHCLLFTLVVYYHVQSLRLINHT